mmetsp:Transcript_20155/g.43781  ORF Transcript_20155/g.43781 Transcript_20155/m.43781 type:complete len:715 (+) Transcript_20155:116-2260(+)|eukprot:CAMPEP_0172320628 /NCGR_PEP_ID=MMETSP1058-20130122/40961_1 /TAXON_ID=83371 /ORGANISM="Detonula confervacea, Strain CCMP 353" /LENGTH=714 /DNA_ID=CAMNT_0013035925 /DNA_START=38 /DNA_END=2182 /DNA_ORIENTATION=+
MKIHSYALTIVLGAHAFSSSTTAFLHSPPRTSTLSVRHNRNNNIQQKTSLSDSSPIISKLGFYPSDEPLSERLKNVQVEWDNVKKEGIGKFFADELDAAENILQGNAADAENTANDVIEKGEGDYLLKEGFHNMAETGKMLANEIWEVRQEFDELKAAKIVEEATEGVISTNVVVERDLEKVMENVVSSLKEAEEAVLSAISTVASKEGLTDSAKAELIEKLEAKAQNIEESIKAADSVAKTAKQIAFDDEKVMSELEKTGDRLSDAIDATESLTNTLKGTEGGAAMDAVSNTVDQAAAIVKEDLSAAESIADAVGQKVVMEADAVMALDAKAADSVRSVRAAKTTIQESSGDDSSESIQAALTKNADAIQGDQNTAEKLAEAIQKDATTDEDALDILESSSKEVNSLIDAVDGAVDKAEDVTTDEVSASSVTEAVEKIEEEVEDVEESMSSVEEAAEKCTDCNVKEVADEMEAESKASASIEEEVDEKEGSVLESKQSEVEEAEKEEDDVVSDSKSESSDESDVEEKDEAVSKSETEDEADEKDQEADIESEVHDAQSVVDEKDQDIEGEKVEDEPVEVSMVDEKEESLTDEPSGATAEDLPESTTITSAHHDGESLGDVVASNVDTSAHHTSYLVSDAAAETASTSISGEDLTDVLASADPPEGFENVLASAASAVSEVGESISSSDTVHDVATSTTEALAEAVAVVASIFL